VIPWPIETQKGVELFKQGEYKKATQWFEAALSKSPGDALNLRDIGHGLFHQQEFIKAFDYYQQALSLNPNLLDVYFNLGLIFVQQGRVNNATFSFMEVIDRVYPLNVNHYYLGLFYDQNRFIQQCRFYLGILFKELGEIEKSVHQYELILAMNPKSILALENLGDGLVLLGRYTQAIHAYKRALKLATETKDRLNLLNDIGIAYFKSEKIEEAISHFKMVLKEEPDNINAIYNLGQVYYCEGLTGRVKKDYEEFIKSSENAASILFSLSKSMISAVSSQKKRNQTNLNLIGEDTKIKAVKELVHRAALSEATVLILGESGTGKELIAHMIHQQSNRFEKNFVPVACSVLNESLLESELFGHERGSFTGATSRKIGKFELADQGTLFLDEIGDIQLSTQIKLLRVLQEREFERVGGNTSIHVNVRILAATNRNLKEEIERGTFREDLFYRLNVIVVEIPPLRERVQDIPLLIRHFLDTMRVQRSSLFHDISSEALVVMQNYSWPGNVRELQNIIERIVTLHDDAVIRLEHLPKELLQTKQILKVYPQDQNDNLKSIERENILRVLALVHFNKQKAARRLGISRPTLYEKIRKYHLDSSDLKV
jgi:transcriptional regulator with PAS, ATPase and Fis domain